MFGNLGEMANMLKKAKDIQKNMAAMKEEMARSEYSAASADQGVVAVVTGDFQLKDITISDTARQAGDLGETVVLTVNAALAAAKNAMQGKMAELTGGLNIPELF